MKKIEFNGQHITVPTTWNEIKLGNYEKWYVKKPQDEMNQIQYVADLCGLDIKLLLDAPTIVLDTAIDIIQFVSEPAFDPSQTIDIGGKSYVASPFDGLTLGEWIDLDTILGSESQTSLSDILAIVCRPMGEAYDHEKSAERAKLFREQSCEKMMPLIRFFLCKKIKFDEALNHFSAVVEAASQFLQDTKTFVASGDGIKQLPIWQRGRYSSLIKSLEKELSKFSDFYSIALTNRMPNSTR